MIDYIYEVRFPENPDPTFTQKFSSKQEALNFADEYPGSEVYMLELDYDDYTGMRGIGELVNEVQIRGPEVDANLADESVPNSCEGDRCDDYTEVEDEAFKLPTCEDDLGEDLKTTSKDMDNLVKELDKPVTDKETEATIAKMAAEDPEVEEEMTDEEFGEKLFSAVQANKPKLEEDSAGMVDDYDLGEDEEICAWCGEAFDRDFLKLDKDLGYLCPQCQAAIMSHEGDDALDFEDEEDDEDLGFDLV